MRPEERDAAYIWDMLDGARTARDLMSGASLESFLNDRKLQLALERTVEIIGEAASRVSESFRQAHPTIPWRKIVAQRNVLAHEYGEVSQDRMWNLATTDIPALIIALEPLVPQPPSQ
jgi:uncharacterized protein with HEPN domain